MVLLEIVAQFKVELACRGPSVAALGKRSCGQARALYYGLGLSYICPKSHISELCLR